MVLEDASFAVDFKTCSIIQTTPNILNNGPRSAELMRSDNEPKEFIRGRGMVLDTSGCASGYRCGCAAIYLGESDGQATRR